jgi:GntR family transcriptional regulator
MHAEPTPGTVAVHHQIADSIRGRIASGDLQPGDPIPTVEELRIQWRCSPGTARSALAVLRAEGLITHGRGKAATVRKPPSRIKLPQSFGQQQKDAVLLPEGERSASGAMELTAGIPIEKTAATYRYSTVPADEQLAADFAVPPGTPLLRREYEMLDPETNNRLSFSISYIPRSLIETNPDLLDERNEPWPGGHQHQLYTVGIELDRIVRSVIAIQPSPAAQYKWGMDSGVPLLVVRSASIDTHNRTVEISEASYPADRSELEFVEKLGMWPSGVLSERSNQEK